MIRVWTALKLLLAGRWRALRFQMRLRQSPKRDTNDTLAQKIRYLGANVCKARGFIKESSDEWDPPKEKMMLLQNALQEWDRRGLESYADIAWSRLQLEAAQQRKTHERKPDVKSQAGDLGTIMRQRASVRSWSSKKVSKDTLKDIIDLALQAPSSCNRMPWQLAVQCNEGAGNGSDPDNDSMLQSAPIVVYVGVDRYYYQSHEEEALDCGILAYALALSAEFKGLSSTQIYRPHASVPENIRKDARGARFYIAVAMGYSDVIPETREGRIGYERVVRLYE